MESSGVVDYSPRSKYDLDFNEIHSGIRPADIRNTDRILARIRPRGVDETGEFEAIQIWKLSPLGVELVQSSNRRFSKGDPVDLEITLAGQRAQFEGLVVDLVNSNDSIELIGY